MTRVEKVREMLENERTRRNEFYEGAMHALKLVEATQVDKEEQSKAQTVGDYIRSMTDEELAEDRQRMECRACPLDDKECCKLDLRRKCLANTLKFIKGVLEDEQ